jgi:hypothetical protein
MKSLQVLLFLYKAVKILNIITSAHKKQNNFHKTNAE